MESTQRTTRSTRPALVVIYCGPQLYADEAKWQAVSARLMRKYPSSPHFEPQLFATNQYLRCCVLWGDEK